MKTLGEAPYEDLEVVFHSRPAGTSYAALAKIYRDYQLGRGAVRPLAERTKSNQTLKYAVEAPEIRIRQAWKPVPSPVPCQTPETEPPVRPVVTFDRVDDIIRSLKSNGVDRAELCLVVDYLRGEWKLEKGTSLAAALCASASVEPEACRPAARFTTAPWWTSRLAATRSAILKDKDACYDLVLVGDSITHRWENNANGAEVYPKLLGDSLDSLRHKKMSGWATAK